MTTAFASQPSSSPLALSQSLTREDLKKVDTLILARASNELPLIHEIARHIIVSGGKRLRPMLMLLAARACGYKKGERHIGLAAAVELIHTATLLHDDVVDESKLRRGMATANDVFGNKASILVGDFLLSQSFQLMVADESLRSLRILSDAAAIISKGEIHQLLTEGNPETTRATYIEVVSCKTAELFAAACELGAVVSDTPHYATAMRTYGQALGIAFQLVDDALDYIADERTLGKTIGDDFREGKITLPVILAYQAGDAEQQAFWQRTLTEREQRPGDLEQAQKFIIKTNGLQDTLTAARTYTDAAAAALSLLAPTPEKQALMEMVDFCVDRMY